MEGRCDVSFGILARPANFGHKKEGVQKIANRSHSIQIQYLKSGEIPSRFCLISFNLWVGWSVGNFISYVGIVQTVASPPRAATRVRGRLLLRAECVTKREVS
eukprot:scaffold9166_cov123-Skeletonema_dohrnii-CCMP3373.AAC.1